MVDVVRSQARAEGRMVDVDLPLERMVCLELERVACVELPLERVVCQELPLELWRLCRRKRHLHLMTGPAHLRQTPGSGAGPLPPPMLRSPNGTASAHRANL